MVAGRPLLVELAVTHFCGPEKVALVREHRLAAIEIDLSRTGRDSAPEVIGGHFSTRRRGDGCGTALSRPPRLTCALRQPRRQHREHASARKPSRGSGGSW
jgi:hypothetical protein